MRDDCDCRWAISGASRCFANALRVTHQVNLEHKNVALIVETFCFQRRFPFFEVSILAAYVQKYGTN